LAQKFKTHQAIQLNELSNYLKEDIKKQLQKNGVITEKILAEYLRTKFSERYFFDWKTFDKRFKNYNELYKSKWNSHASRAQDHISKYSDSTQWVLPFNYLNGNCKCLRAKTFGSTA